MLYEVITNAIDGYVEALIPVEIARGEPIRVEKVCTLYTSRDKAISEAGLAAREALDRCRNIAQLQQTHIRAWSNYWDRCDIALHPSMHEEQKIIRLHIYHLLQTASNHTLDLDVGLPSRGWTGESYRGHVFWDEVFMLPFLTYRLPIVSRSLLEYRFMRLGRARLNAQLEGTYHNLAFFFDKISKFPRLINVGEVKIRAKAPPEPTWPLPSTAASTGRSTSRPSTQTPPT